MEKEWSTLRKLIWLHMLLGGGAVTWTTVTGTSPLSLVNALAKPLKSLIQYGKCVQDGTPTLENPVPIKCNNGTLMMVDDELPSGYKRLLGLTFAASTYYVIEGFFLKGSDTVRFSFSVDKACNVFGCYTNTSATDNYSLYMSTASGAKYLRYGGSTYNSYISSARFGDRLDVVLSPTGTSGMPTDSVITPETFEGTADLCIGHTSPTGTSSKLDGNIWGNFTVDGRLKLIPCERASDGALGYFDTYSETFYEPLGSAPTSMGYDNSHKTVLDVVGTKEVITLGEQTASAVDLLSWKTNTTTYADTQDIISGEVKRIIGVKVFDGTEKWSRILKNGYVCLYHVLVGGVKNTYVMSNVGVYKGPSVTAGNDDHWTILSNQSQVQFFPNSAYKNFDTADQWKEYLAEQYAKGEPVILLYKKATATTEQVEPQELSTSAGNNTLTVTAEISDIQFTAEYAASA